MADKYQEGYSAFFTELSATSVMKPTNTAQETLEALCGWLDASQGRCKEWVLPEDPFDGEDKGH